MGDGDEEGQAFLWRNCGATNALDRAVRFFSACF